MAINDLQFSSRHYGCGLGVGVGSDVGSGVGVGVETGVAVAGGAPRMVNGALATGAPLLGT